MKERINPLSSYQKQFKKLKTQADRIAFAKSAVRDQAILQVRPEAMDYNVANYQNEGQGALCLDVDDVLFGEVGDRIIINDAFIMACLKRGYTDVYLVTSMSLKLDDRFSRVDLIAYLALWGINVKGVVTEADAVKDVKLGDFYHDYYLSVMAGEIDEKVKAKQDGRKREAEQLGTDYFAAMEKNHADFGKKVMMFRKLLSLNPGIKKLLFVDDSSINLSGITYDYMTNPYHDAIVATLPINKVSSEIDEPTSAKQYIKMLKSFQQGKREPMEAYAARIQPLMLESLFADLAQGTFYGKGFLPQYDGFRAALKAASHRFHTGDVAAAALLEDVYQALIADRAAFDKADKPSASVSRSVQEAFDRIESTVSMWKHAFAAEAPKATKKGKVPPAVAHALVGQSMYRSSSEAKNESHRPKPRPKLSHSQ